MLRVSAGLVVLGIKLYGLLGRINSQSQVLLDAGHIFDLPGVLL